MAEIDRGERLDALIESAGGRAIAGYRDDVDDVVAWVLQAPRHLALTETAARGTWLLAEVGVGGGGFYPEDDLAEEADIRLPTAHALLWDDNLERAILARRLEALDVTVLQAALGEFVALAEDVERRLTEVEELLIDPASGFEDPAGLQPLWPPDTDSDFT